MYADPTHVSDTVIKVRLSNLELRLLMAAIECNRSSSLAFTRDLIVGQLSHQDTAAHDER